VEGLISSLKPNGPRTGIDAIGEDFDSVSVG